MSRPTGPTKAARGRRFDPLGLWLCGLGALGLARAWLYLVRDGGTAGPVGWIWLGGSVLLACIGLVLLVRRWLAESHGRSIKNT
ncbi:MULTISPECIES: hypothetical protein [unclassified Luteimonas]